MILSLEAPQSLSSPLLLGQDRLGLLPTDELHVVGREQAVHAVRAEALPPAGVDLVDVGDDLKQERVKTGLSGIYHALVGRSLALYFSLFFERPSKVRFSVVTCSRCVREMGTVRISWVKR